MSGITQVIAVYRGEVLTEYFVTTGGEVFRRVTSSSAGPKVMRITLNSLVEEESKNK